MHSNSLRHSQPLVRTLDMSSLLASALVIFSEQGRIARKEVAKLLMRWYTGTACLGYPLECLHDPNA